MAREGSGWGAVLRQGEVAVRVRDVNESTGSRFATDLGELIAAGETAQIEALVDAEHLMERLGVPRDSLEMGVPLANPERILGIGLNYHHHASDLGVAVPAQPGTFLKTRNTLQADGRVSLPDASQRVTAEGEVALVFGRDAKSVGIDDAPEVIWGALAVLDLTAEDVLRLNPRFLTRAKGYDGFFVMSPWMVPWTAEEFFRVRRIDTLLNGAVKATNTTDHMTHSFAALIQLVTADVSMGATAILSTGTPGAVVIQPGDHVSAEIEGLYGVEFVVES